MLVPIAPATSPLARMSPAAAPGPSSATVATSTGTVMTAVERSTTPCIWTAATAALAPPAFRESSTARAASPAPRPIGSTSPRA